MTVINAVGNALTGSTGTGTFVGSASPTFTGIPILAASSATSLTFTSTSGIIGTTTNDNAAAGSVGELLSSVVLTASAVSVNPSGTQVDITSLVLQPGDYDVWGELWTKPGASTTTSGISVGINTVSATIALTPSVNTSTNSFNSALTAGSSTQLSVGGCRISVATATTTTVYLVGYVTFAVSTMAVYGKLMARRRR